MASNGDILGRGADRAIYAAAPQTSAAIYAPAPLQEPSPSQNVSVPDIPSDQETNRKTSKQIRAEKKTGRELYAYPQLAANVQNTQVSL